MAVRLLVNSMLVSRLVMQMVVGRRYLYLLECCSPSNGATDGATGTNGISGTNSSRTGHRTARRHQAIRSKVRAPWRVNDR